MTKRHFTKYYQLRKVCEALVDQPAVVEADELEELVQRIAVAAIEAIGEQRDDYLEFISQPKIYKYFDKWMQERVDGKE